MLKTPCVAALSLFLLTSLPARGAGKEDLQAAVKKLADAGSYAWTSKTETSGGPGVGTAEGAAEKDGFTIVKLNVFDNDFTLVKKGDKGAVKTDEGWQSFDELAGPAPGDQPNRGRFIGMMMRNYRTPVEVAQHLAAAAKDLKPSGDAVEADLTEAGAKDLLTFRGRQDGQGPEISGAKGTAKFWLKDGGVSKIEYHLQGSVNFNGEDRDIDRTTTIEIKDVGKAKAEVPEEARKKVE